MQCILFCILFNFTYDNTWPLFMFLMLWNVIKYTDIEFSPRYKISFICISYFSFVLIEHHDWQQFKEEVYLGFWFQKDKHPWWCSKGMTASNKHAWSPEKEAEVPHLESRARCWEQQNVREAINSQSPSTCCDILPQLSSTSKQYCQLEIQYSNAWYVGGQVSYSHYQIQNYHHHHHYLFLISHNKSTRKAY